jgi:ribonuclease P protein component
VFVAEPGSQQRAVAYAISRKVGNAVVRNKIRRRLRAGFDGLSPVALEGYYLIKCGNGTKDLSYDELRTCLASAVKRANGL